ncbi:MAG TPA: ABC transporter substrate-binding protein [Defluviitaleaceae bacterium]|jgi:NitT/TauT family transport system substrate-binding protein|nr:ABC transporter substrate-binding protein [Candidatus Epulonipiscium sp.]HOA81546.1 ABC transporter substrate-binding protein [Defluviitaleaceae bacterium]
MNKKKTCILILLIIIMASAFFSGCSKEELTVVRLNEVVHSVFYAPQYVAIEKGFFEEEGLKIELTSGWGADKSMTALISGDADIGMMGTEAAIYVYNQGKENYGVVFAQQTQRAGNFLVSREDEKDFQWTDLKGKTVIGGRPGGMPQMVFEYILKQNGLKPFEDVEIITNLQFTATAGAFASGTGDYSIEFEPTASTLEVQNNGYVVASLGTASGKVPYTVFMASKEYIENNPEIIQKFTNAFYKAQVWVKEHSPEEIAEVIHPQFKETDKELLVKIIKRYKDQDTWCETPIMEEESLTLLQDILESAGELEKRVPYDEIVTREFAEKAIGK